LINRFIEAQGNFYIIKKDNINLVHAFSITQKKDKYLLEYIKYILNIKSELKSNKKGYHSLDTTNKNSLKFIKDYFFKTMKSRKALIYRI
jgi:hypothetical protein